MSGRRRAALVLAAMGAIGLAISGWLFAGVYVAGESVRGRVVDLRLDGQGTNPVCFPIVEYAVNGEPRRATTQVGASGCAHEVGEAVTVYYWPERPDEPALLSFGVLLPVWVSLGVCVMAAFVFLGAPKSSERVAEAVEVDPGAAQEGALVKVRGKIEPTDDPLSAPLTGRPCVAWWARVVERAPGEPDRKVRDGSSSAPFVVRARGGSARVEATVKLIVDADDRGDSMGEPSDALESFLEPEGVDPSLGHYVWYEGVFRAGDEVFAVGRARRLDAGSIAIEPPEGEPVLLQHVDREERRRRARELAREV